MKNRSRLQKPLFRLSGSKSSSNFDIHQDRDRDIVNTSRTDLAPLAPNESSRATLSAVSLGHMNTRTMVTASSIRLQHDGKALPSIPNNTPSLSPYASQHGTPDIPRRMSTIRAVPSYEDRRLMSDYDEFSSEGSPSARQRNSNNSAFSNSLNSDVSAISIGSRQQPSIRLKHSPSGTFLETPGSGLEVPSRTSSPGSQPRSSFEIPQRESSRGATRPNINTTTGMVPITRTISPPFDGPLPANGQMDGALSLSATEAKFTKEGDWDSTVGKAGLGKTGRVINRLVSENDGLKRDLKIERLRADEARQAARLLEDRMERVISDYESRLLEANVTKTLLARKERQVESLQSAAELERRRTADAQERERTWCEEAERARAEAKRQVDEACSHAALMEGRYNAISSHWRDQGGEVKKAVTKMRKEVGELVEDRARDDDKIETLRDLCDQQDGNIRDLRRQKDEIAQKFDEYKAEQEDALRDIKTNAAAREREQEGTILETREVLDKLKWALNVKEKIGWAE